MTLDFAVFLSINEARRYAPRDDKGEIEINGLVHQFINKCFFETQATAIRRLLDKETRRGQRSVISLYRLIHDMQQNSKLLTRESILAAHGYPYEWEEEERRLSDEAFSNGVSEFRVMGDDYRNCRSSEYAHKSIDFLAGVQPSERQPDDCVGPQVFEWLKQRLSRCKGIAEFVNKFLAHAATPDSRGYRDPPELDVTLRQIVRANKIICEIVTCIGQMGVLSDGVGALLPTFNFDQFVHFDKLWASHDVIDNKLRPFWQKHECRIGRWQRWDWRRRFARHLR